MASLEEAYSIEYDNIINTEDAYELYWAGVIFNKSAFVCPSELCDAKVTCVNLDLEKQDMQQSVHFRGYKHSLDCDATIGKKSNTGTEKTQDTNSPRITQSEHKPDSFHLFRPLNQFAKKQKGSPTKGKNRIISERNAAGLRQQDRKTGSDYYSVRSLVSKFIRYKTEGTLAEHYITIDKKNISYQALFKGVFNQNIENLPNENKVYWGVANINYIAEKKLYHVKFKSEMKHGGTAINPSFFITEKQIQDYPVRNLVIKRLTKIAQSHNKQAFIFLYSKPYGQGKHYINFKLESLDYLEIRYLDLFDELKKTPSSTDNNE
ncbi:hypothetical protein [Vibrio sagamiensis]|uniref:Uncharacterized protein n=1 Tax=Vibrio sagamiensis NBRC 104589 TaxID=1219064 RepID=A0A511QKI7_9VIBR|nr:hypothetical protein [Vibrio sagamiensis]PNQ66319.1 hypothetical protein C1141_08750 [Vibrio agarivorans]GEM77556.1 hypothetical protein VSA01S_36680 [Vibrio sagamiensis NBRC 104589]